jgi:hypothetical protein
MAQIRADKRLTTVRDQINQLCPSAHSADERWRTRTTYLPVGSRPFPNRSRNCFIAGAEQLPDSFRGLTHPRGHIPTALGHLYLAIARRPRCSCLRHFVAGQGGKDEETWRGGDKERMGERSNSRADARRQDHALRRGLRDVLPACETSGALTCRSRRRRGVGRGPAI